MNVAPLSRLGSTGLRGGRSRPALFAAGVLSLALVSSSCSSGDSGSSLSTTSSDSSVNDPGVLAPEQAAEDVPLQATTPDELRVLQEPGAETFARLTTRGGPLPASAFSSPVVIDGTGGFYFNSWDAVGGAIGGAPVGIPSLVWHQSGGEEEVIADGGFAPLPRLADGTLAFGQAVASEVGGFWAESKLMARSPSGNTRVLYSEPNRMVYPVAWLGGNILALSESQVDNMTGLTERDWRLLNEKGELLASGQGAAYFANDQSLQHFIVASDEPGQALSTLSARDGSVVDQMSAEEYATEFLNDEDARTYLEEGGFLDDRRYLPISPVGIGVAIGPSVVLPLASGLMVLDRSMISAQFEPVGGPMFVNSVVTVGKIWEESEPASVLVYVNAFDLTVAAMAPTPPPDLSDPEVAGDFEEELRIQAERETGATSEALLRCSLVRTTCEVIYERAIGAAGPLWLGIKLPDQPSTKS